MSTFLASQENLDVYAVSLRSDFVSAYVKAIDKPEAGGHAEAMKRIAASFAALIAGRDGWSRNSAQSSQDISLTFRNGMRIHIEPVQSENLGMLTEVSPLLKT